MIAVDYLADVMAAHCPGEQYRAYLKAMPMPRFLEEWRAVNSAASQPSEPYTVVGDNMVSVCGHCYPGRSIKTLFPHLKDATISHGICQGHKARYMVELRFNRERTA